MNFVKIKKYVVLGSHHVPYYVLGDDCWDNVSPCKHFFYREHDIKGLQFALMFYNGKVIGAVFGDTQTGNNQTTSDNDSRELGEASVAAADMLGIPSSGTTGGVDDGVTVVIFSGPEWVLKGTNRGTGPIGSATGSLSGNAGRACIKGSKYSRKLLGLITTSWKCEKDSSFSCFFINFTRTLKQIIGECLQKKIQITCRHDFTSHF